MSKSRHDRDALSALRQLAREVEHAADERAVRALRHAVDRGRRTLDAERAERLRTAVNQVDRAVDDGAHRALRFALDHGRRALDSDAASRLRAAAARADQAVDDRATRVLQSAVARARDPRAVEILDALVDHGRHVMSPSTLGLLAELLLSARYLLDPETLDALHRAAREPVDPDGGGHEDVDLVRRLSPPVDALVRSYFRFEVEGTERVPEGPALVVSNHEGGITFVQVLGMGARYHLEQGFDERIMGLMHDAMFEVPYLGNILGHLGAIRASHRSADAAFARGHKVYVAPGGNLEAFRPWSERFRIKFGGRRGWIRLARRNGVPIVPVVFVGGQETFFVLRDGEYLAHNLGLKRRLRVDTLPLFVGLPWGIGVGPLFHLPLPAKCKARFLEPVPTDAIDGETEEQTEARLFAEVTGVMQSALSEMASERRLPILG